MLIPILIFCVGVMPLISAAYYSYYLDYPLTYKAFYSLGYLLAYKVLVKKY